MRIKLAAVLLLILSSATSRAGVIVLANRTNQNVTFSAAGAVPQSVAPFYQAVLFAERSITVSFASGKDSRTYRLDPDAAYFFADMPDGSVAIHGIGPPGNSSTPPPDKPDAGLQKPPPVKIIPIRIFVDEEEPAARPAWEARLRKRIALASDVLEQTCRVRFEVTDADTWNSDNQAADLPALLTDFEHKVRRGNSPLLIGFTSQRTPEETGILHLGGTRVPLHPYILLREWTPASEPGRLEVLLHELGHYLGAVHSPEPVSVMRPKLGDGRVLDARFPVGYDPLNALAMNLIAGEIRTRPVHSLAQLTEPTKERLRQIYREVQPAMADDATPAKFLALLGPPPGRPEPPKEEAPKQEVRNPEPPKEEPRKPDAPKPEAAPESTPVSVLVKNARVIIATIVKAGEKNQKLPDRATPGTAPPFRRSGDALTEYYVREAAAVARDMPPGEASPAFLVGLSIALDTADLFRNNPVTGNLWRRIEPDEERERRLKVLGQPTIFARHDSCQHFVDSAALVALRGPLAAEAAGIVKELLDSQKGGSGFSFADLASDMSGVAFGREVIAEPGLLVRLANGFSVADFAVPPDGLVEGLTYEEFSSRFGSVADRRFLDEQKKLRDRVSELPAYRPAAALPERAPEKPAEEKRPLPEPVTEKKPPEESAPPPKPAEKKEEPPAKVATEPAPVPPAPSPPSPEGTSSSPTASNASALTLAQAGLGFAALAGALYSFRPRRAALPNQPAARPPIFFGIALALAGLVLLGGAYARWSWPGEPESSSPDSTVTDLDPTWVRAPLDPFEIPAFRAIHLPTIPGARSVAGATGRDGRGHIWFAVSASNEADASARIMEYNPESGEVSPRSDVVAELRRSGLQKTGERQGTICSRLALAADGCLYFASSDEDGTAGSHLWRIRPLDSTWEHLFAVPDRKLVATACAGPYVYALGQPDHMLYQFDRASNGVHSTKVGSVEGQFSNNILADRRGHAYVPQVRQDPAGIVTTLVEYSRNLQQVTESALDPAGPEARGSLHGLVAVQPLADHTLVFVTDRGFLYRLTPGEDEQAAKVIALGAFHPRGESNVVALFSPDGRRYLMGLARRQPWRDAPFDWLVCDLETNRPVVVPVPPAEEDGRALKELRLSGCMTSDDQGRFYLGGSYRRNSQECPVLFQIRGPH
jgi:hypothetical protein